MFRLFDFNIIDKFQAMEGEDGEDEAEEGEAEGGGGGGNYRKKQDTFVIQMFGINEIGETCSIFVDDYKPFFYVLVNDDWTKSKKDEFIDHIKQSIGKYHSRSICASYLIKRKKLYGFDNGKHYKFVRIDFDNVSSFNKTRNLWYIMPQKDQKGPREMRLNRDGYHFSGCVTRLYESNIPPILRFFHIQEISPSGWIEVINTQPSYETFKRTTCNYEYQTSQKNIISHTDKETPVPYKICSFDIEASSSHGDFPVPVKSYKKLANNIIEYFEKDNPAAHNKVDSGPIISDIIRTAFNCLPSGKEPIKNIDAVYPIYPPSAMELENRITRFFDPLSQDKSNSEDDVLTIEKMFEKNYNKQIEMNDAMETSLLGGRGTVADNSDDEDADDDAGSDDEDDDDAAAEGDGVDEEAHVHSGGGGSGSGGHKDTLEKEHRKARTYNIINILCDKRYKRETIVDKITEQLGRCFPKLEGDKVTFIGSTFLTYGQKEPYLNHCIALNTCNPVRDCVIETYESEREVLLAWTELIQRENPDIIIGYNIFGFDYEFMYRRARENRCVEDFLKLSRNKDEVCGKLSPGTMDDYKIEVTSMKQFEIKFIKIPGRMQVDLYNYFRREENFISYKLDYVAGQYIGDSIKKIEELNVSDGITEIYTKNLTGLKPGNFIHIEETGYSTEYYDGGRKYCVLSVDNEKKSFTIQEKNIRPDMENKKVRWCMAKDDVSPQDIFRLTNGTADDRAIIAKYCIADCNLVHYLMGKADVLTGFVEMARICSVPMNFLVMRGQGIKLTSYVSKKCREKGVLMPVIENGNPNDAYEGAIVLDPKCNLYLDNPVACVDFASLYPSSIISENLSHDTKVWTKTYDLEGNLISELGEKSPSTGEFMYDNLAGCKYVDITYDMYNYRRKPNRSGIVTAASRFEKILVGRRICRYVQPNKSIGKGIMPSILEELLGARKATRKQQKGETDEFMKNVLDKRQLGYKVTANSLYGQCGAKTSTFYEQDIAASTTSTGRLLLTYAKKIIEDCYGGGVTVNTEKYGSVKTYAEYIYGDTDSVFFTFNLTDMDGAPIRGFKALDLTIEIAQQAGHLASSFLKQPHDLEYEKTFMPFCLLSKKRYVGILYETDPTYGKRKEMGIVLKRRDNAPIVKDVYGGVIDILMKKQSVEEAIRFLQTSLQDIVDERVSMEKLIITKSLRSYYKNPQGIAHKVLADRIGVREPGNKPGSGDRIPYVYIVAPPKVKQGEKIETPSYVLSTNLKLDYSFYITNQIMKPVSQVFALILPLVCNILKKPMPSITGSPEKLEEKRMEEIQNLLFVPALRQSNNKKKGLQPITSFFKTVKK
jgi:DNA polymerase elongation subunit (family B)